MHTIINPSTTASRSLRPKPTVKTSNFRQPSYDCRELPDAVRLTVYVPGVEAAGVEIEARGPDLLVTARKTHFVRVNWQSLHLESAQRDFAAECGLPPEEFYADSFTSEADKH